MDFVFDDGDAAVVRLVQNQLIGGSKRDIINIAPECSHQIGSPLYHARPAGDIVKDFVDYVVGDDVEEVLAINEIAQRTSNQIKVRRSILVDSVFGHSTLSKRFTGLLRLIRTGSCPLWGQQRQINDVRASRLRPRFRTFAAPRQMSKGAKPVVVYPVDTMRVTTASM
jgi:hypothetical protein